MDFIEIITGRFLLNYIGGNIRFIYGTLWRTIFNKPKFTFKEYIKGPKKSNHYDDFGHQFNNRIIEAIFLGIIIFILVNYYL
ncbi:hypothetical protein [Flavobacterium sp. CAN_S2]|uniref:hypothetical protein n=1 Tax=Flavobacterium sp. CAN_S2 TaxID=2787726 RepID=UPI0018CBCD4D